MPIRLIDKIKHTALPTNEGQKNYYITKLLDQINLIRNNISAYEANAGNHANEQAKALKTVEKLRSRLKPIQEEYKKIQAMDFTKEPEPAPEPEVAETIPPEEPEPEPEPEADELDDLLADKGISRESLIELIKKG